MFVVDKKTIKMVVERHGGIKGITNGVPGALVDRKGLETVGVDPGPHPQLLVLYELLLDPGQTKLSITVVVLVPIPAHHIQDVEDRVALAVDAVQDSVLIPGPALVPVPAG